MASEETIGCPHCGKEQRANRTVCWTCGKDLRSEPDPDSQPIAAAETPRETPRPFDIPLASAYKPMRRYEMSPAEWISESFSVFGENWGSWCVAIFLYGIAYIVLMVSASPGGGWPAILAIATGAFLLPVFAMASLAKLALRAVRGESVSLLRAFSGWAVLGQMVFYLLAVDAGFAIPFGAMYGLTRMGSGGWFLGIGIAVGCCLALALFALALPGFAMVADGHSAASAIKDGMWTFGRRSFWKLLLAVFYFHLVFIGACIGSYLIYVFELLVFRGGINPTFIVELVAPPIFFILAALTYRQIAEPELIKSRNATALPVEAPLVEQASAL